MLLNVKRPKQSNLTVMQDYIMAEQIGLKKGNCLKVFPQCPISLFNFLPDVYTKDDEVTVSFDPPGSRKILNGSQYKKFNITFDLQKKHLGVIFQKLSRMGKFFQATLFYKLISVVWNFILFLVLTVQNLMIFLPTEWTRIPFSMRNKYALVLAV